MAGNKSSTRTNNVVNSRNSRYVQGGLSDRHPTRVGWWERKILEYQDTDYVIEIRPNESTRPDLVAYRIYNKPELAWLVLQYNNIVDVQTEFVTGVELRLPNQRRLALDILSQTTGGNIV